MKKIAIIMVVLTYAYCSGITENEIERSWLADINNTKWSNGSKTLEFDHTGKVVTTEKGLRYNYNYLDDLVLGVYTTDIAFPPTEWYAFFKGDDLMQYGPFLSADEISRDTQKLTVFTQD